MAQRRFGVDLEVVGTIYEFKKAEGYLPQPFMC